MKLGFFGFGNMAKATAEGFEKAGMSRSEMGVCAASEETRALAKGLGHPVFSGISELAAFAETVVIAVKPKVFFSLAEEMAGAKIKKLVSFMATVTAAETSAAAGGTPVIRVIPTLAIASGKDICGVFSGENRESFADFLSLLGRVGKIYELEEERLMSFTLAVSCGLGFAAHIEAAYEKGVLRLGFTPEEAHGMTAAVFSAAAEAENFEALSRRVATKGGLTEHGMAAFNSAGGESAILKMTE